jgi:hypothetical protein
MKLKLDQYIGVLIGISLITTITDSDSFMNYWDRLSFQATMFPSYWDRWLFLGDNIGYVINNAISSLSIITIVSKFFFFLVLSLPFYLSYCLFFIFYWFDDKHPFFWPSERTKKFVRFLLGVFCVFFIAVLYYIVYPLLYRYNLP